jgi:hypothetical protein
MNFYKSVFVIMVIVLIVCLSFLGVIIMNSKKDKKFPSVTSDCPDYFVKNDDGHCVNKHAMGDGPTDSCTGAIDFQDLNKFPNAQNPGMGKNSAICEKKKWANNCGVQWDGITTNDNICFATI